MTGLLSTNISVTSCPVSLPPLHLISHSLTSVPVSACSQHFLTLVQVRPYAPGLGSFQLFLLHSFDLPVISSVTSYCTSVDTTTCASGSWLPQAGAAGLWRMCRVFSNNRTTTTTTSTNVKNYLTHVKFGLVGWLSQANGMLFLYCDGGGGSGILKKVSGTCSRTFSLLRGV